MQLCHSKLQDQKSGRAKNCIEILPWFILATLCTQSCRVKNRRVNNLCKTGFFQCCRAGTGAGSRKAEIKLAPGAGAVIMNYGFGSGFLLFYQRFDEILQKEKSRLLKNAKKKYKFNFLSNFNFCS
jgi:hypothetical protein